MKIGITVLKMWFGGQMDAKSAHIYVRPNLSDAPGDWSGLAV